MNSLGMIFIHFLPAIISSGSVNGGIKKNDWRFFIIPVFMVLSEFGL